MSAKQDRPIADTERTQALKANNLSAVQPACCRQPIVGVLESFSKGQSASNGVLGLGLINRAFQDSIEYSATFKAFRGMALFFGLLAAAVAFDATWSAVRNFSDTEVPFQVIGFAIAAFFAVGGVWIALLTIRMELFAPADQPVMFDRRNRRGYRLYQEQKPGLAGLFQPWALAVGSYDWNLVEAQHVAQLGVNAAAVTRRHQLRFVVRRSAQDPTMVATFQVGTAQVMGDPVVPMVWEHIRRFMEEHGPAVPPGEGTLSEIGPLSWRGTYVSWWRMFTFPMILAHLVFPITAPLVLALALLNWLTRITALPAVWPEEIRKAVGEPIAVMQAN